MAEITASEDLHPVRDIETPAEAHLRSIGRRFLLTTITTGLLAMTTERAMAAPPQGGAPATDHQVGVRLRPPLPLLVSFVAGNRGRWKIDSVSPVIGQGLPSAARLDVIEGRDTLADHASDWSLRGTTSNTRYTTRQEVDAMAARQEGLNRPAATRAALIPIRKNDAWWSLAQDERRAIFEDQSRHIAIGIEYLPAVARRLHHSRELGEPFDFLTWFEYAPGDSAAFEKLVERLRATPEWRFVDREVDIRLSRA